MVWPTFEPTSNSGRQQRNAVHGSAAQKVLRDSGRVVGKLKLEERASLRMARYPSMTSS
jgi:hypothetical protein